MTPKISLIIGVAIAALTVVPAAFGEGRLAGSQEPATVAPDWFERAAIAAQTQAIVVSRPDSHDTLQPVTNGYVDAAGRAQRINVVVPTALTDSFERSVPPTSSPMSSIDAAGSDSDRDWTQLGMGFGIGLLLALGLYLAMRLTRIRPLAH